MCLVFVFVFVFESYMKLCSVAGCLHTRAGHRACCHYADTKYCYQHSCPRCRFRQPIPGRDYCSECRWMKGSRIHWCYSVPNKYFCEVEGCKKESMVHGQFCGEHSCKHCTNKRAVLSDMCYNCDNCYYYYDGSVTRGSTIFAVRKLQIGNKVSVQETSILYDVIHKMNEDTFKELLAYFI
jgi:hypothetical protein